MKKIRTPVATLVAMAALGLVMLLANQTRGPDVDTAAAPPGGPTTAPPAASAPGAAQPGAPPGGASPGTAQPDAGADTATEPETAYTGYTSTGRRMSVAVVVQGDRAVAYVCDGADVEAWLQGSAADDRVELSRADGTRLTGTRGEGKLTGTVWVNDRSYRFSAAVAGPPAGLYESRAGTDGRTDRIGWIVQPDGSQVGIRTADGRSQTAPQLNEWTLRSTIDGAERGAERVRVGWSR